MGMDVDSAARFAHGYSPYARQPTSCPPSAWRGDHERLRRIEYPSIHEARFLRLALEFTHRAGQTHPVQDLLLAGVLDLGAGIVPPSFPVAGAQGIVHASVGSSIRPEEVVLLCQESVAPSRRGK